MAFGLRCDCGLGKIARRNGTLVCSHCDVAGCDGNCSRCKAYTSGIIRRVILTTYGH